MSALYHKPRLECKTCNFTARILNNFFAGWLKQVVHYVNQCGKDSGFWFSR